MAASPERDALALRIRAGLPADAPVREVGMFGGLAFMVDERLAVSARRAGNLLVHVDPARYDDLLSRPGARPAEMGTGRAMGRGWLVVDAGVLDDEATLARWLAEGLRPGA